MCIISFCTGLKWSKICAKPSILFIQSFARHSLKCRRRESSFFLSKERAISILKQKNRMMQKISVVYIHINMSYIYICMLLESINLKKLDYEMLMSFSFLSRKVKNQLMILHKWYIFKIKKNHHLYHWY